MQGDATADTGFAWGNLNTFFSNNFNVTISGVPVETINPSTQQPVSRPCAVEWRSHFRHA